MVDNACAELGVTPDKTTEMFPGTLFNFSADCHNQCQPLQHDPQRSDEFLDLRTLLATEIDTDKARPEHESIEYATHGDDLWLEQLDFTIHHDLEQFNGDLARCLNTKVTDELVDQPTPELSWSPSTSLWPPSESPRESSPTSQPMATSRRKERNSPNKRQRRPKRANKELSSLPDLSGASPSADETIHRRHRKIEKKYRCKMATNFDKLHAAVPTLLDRDESLPPEEDLLGLKTTRKKSKSTTLAKAAEYIEALKNQYYEQKSKAEEAVEEAKQLRTRTKECLTLLLE